MNSEIKSVLIVEDERSIKDILSFNLEKEGYKVFTCEDAIRALEILREENISIVLMDVMMPKMDGFECTRKIREFSNIPIMLLTALEDEQSKLQVFECGINDYVVKPFSIKEVVARIKVHLAAASNMIVKKSLPEIIQINDIQLKTLDCSVTVGDKSDVLTDTEYKLLVFLYQNPNTVFNREILMREVWGMTYTDSRTIDVTVMHLRDKIEVDASSPQSLKTKRGEGYYLEIA